MIYVTGDTHGLIDFDKLSFFAALQDNLTRKDYVIISGDFGGVWGEETEESLEEYENLPFTVLFVDGNHEDYGLLNQYPVEEWNGGKVQFVKPHVIHLMRGQVFTIDGNKIFTLGGAESHDKQYRVNRVSWWREEIPNQQQIEEARINLDRHNWKVDYVITHSCDTYSLYVMPLSLNRREGRIENDILCEFEEKLKYTHWYFGHYHIDFDINSKKTVLYNRILKLGERINED